MFFDRERAPEIHNRAQPYVVKENSLAQSRRVVSYRKRFVVSECIVNNNFRRLIRMQPHHHTSFNSDLVVNKGKQERMDTPYLHPRTIS